MAMKPEELPLLPEARLAEMEDVYDRDVRALIEEVRRARLALRLAEWGGTTGEGHACCPVCRGVKPGQGAPLMECDHDQDCRLGTLLSAPAPKPPAP